MRLWEKNYLLTMALLLLILYGSVFFIQSRSIQKNFAQTCENSLWIEQNILSSVQDFFYADETHAKLDLYCRNLEAKNIPIALYLDGEVFRDFLPIEIPAVPTDSSQIIRKASHRYLLISSSFSIKDQNAVLYYMENLDSFYADNRRQTFLFLAVNAALSLLLAGILHSAIKKMYRPIDHISHELRTPLTAIQGYAQYILLGNISLEDIHYASGQIDREARYLNEIIDRLLVMDHIQNGTIHLEKLDPAELFHVVQAHYPSVTIENTMPSILGDRSLLLCLLMNLLSNTERAGDSITITASPGKIIISNPQDFLEEKMLKLLNDNKPLPKDKIHGRGLGVPLCHEITKLHHGSLRYASSKETGVTITITF